ADDFIVGIIGPKADAQALMTELKAFMKNNLKVELAEEKTGIVNSSEDTRFLGYDLKVITDKHRVVKSRGGSRRSMLVGVATLEWPMQSAVKFAWERGYIDNIQDHKTRPRTNLLELSEEKIIRRYIQELRGVSNYYSRARNWKHVGNLLHWWCQDSLARTRFILRDLDALAGNAVQRLVSRFDEHDRRIETYKQTRLRDTTAHDLIIRAVDKGVCSNQHIPKILQEWRHPAHACFQPCTLWSLQNAFTEALKGNINRLPTRTEKLHRLLDLQAGDELRGSRRELRARPGTPPGAGYQKTPRPQRGRFFLAILTHQSRKNRIVSSLENSDLALSWFQHATGSRKSILQLNEVLNA
ncbi:MAG: group II intron reverse transcriptase/maturase, partial [Verrucomicrobiota bacterium JB024]|nr:group II intron reverse transcriptase/maturase [Verrucomicrobiota bacterium JB024]